MVSDSLRSEVGLYLWEHKRFPNADDVAVTGDIGQQADTLNGKYVATNGVSIMADTGVITVNFDAGNIAGKTLVMTPKINMANNQQVIQWVCSGTVNIDKLPFGCQD